VKFFISFRIDQATTRARASHEASGGFGRRTDAE
jgi:hypothetical protein